MQAPRNCFVLFHFVLFCFLCCCNEYNKCASAELFLLTEFFLVSDLALTLLSNPDLQ